MKRRWWMVGIAVAAVAWWALPSSRPREARLESAIHVKLAPGAGDAWTHAVGGLAVQPAAPLFTRDPAALAVDRLAATARGGKAVPDLTTWRRITLRGTRREIVRAVARLEARPDVVTAFEAPRPALPSIAGASCPLKTPPYHQRQGYLGPAPGGIDATYAWKLPGGHGERVAFADVEGAWNAAHEDLPGERIESVGREMRGREWEAHGTAVLGEVAARDNALGMHGIAPGVARIVVSSIADVSPAAAIDLAQARLGPGDVLLIELHAIGPRGRFLPMEFWDDVFEAISVATARGVIVIEAAGNGAEDLDHLTYRGKLDRRKRDSGAIMVGAGAPALPGWVDRSRLDFSNHGSRVDVQGWGRMVATLDYGDLQGCDVHGRKYTVLFAGTSSASPIVAGAALLLQSVVREQTGCTLSPAEMRRILVETGTPQTDGPHGSATQRIGPRPDLARATPRALAAARCD